MIKQTFDALLNIDTPAIDLRGIDSLAFLIESTRFLIKALPACQLLLSTIPTSALIFRLKGGPNDDWQSVDCALSRIFESGLCRLEPQSACHLILGIVLREN